MKKNTSKIGTFFKNIGLLLRCLFASLSFATLWVGIALHAHTYGVFLIIIGALAVILSLFMNIILPISRLK